MTFPALKGRAKFRSTLRVEDTLPPWMSDISSDAIVVLITAANRDEAVRIAEMLVDARLAGCVQVLPEIESIYRWQGEVARETEILLLVKTTRDKFDHLANRVTAIHSYETPEIIALPVTSAAEPYRKWLLGSLSAGS
jgi:periplasmic divalent cation tolerance protein